MAPRPPSPNPPATSSLPSFTASSPGWGRTSRPRWATTPSDFRRAQAAGTPLTVPRVAELLADPAFRPLDDWLRQRQADVAEVQAAVDQALDMARQVALEQK